MVFNSREHRPKPWCKDNISYFLFYCKVLNFFLLVGKLQWKEILIATGQEPIV
jgi:hypothetical protein